MPRNNLRQLAKLAGVSVATASYALRGHPCVAEATRQRVLRAVRKIGYRTNPLVAALMTQVQAGRPVQYHGTIGVCYDPAMFPEGPDSLKADRFYQGAVRQAAAQGFTTELFRFDAINTKPAHHSRILQARGIQGVLFLPIFQSPVRLELDVQSLAVCCVGYPIVQPDLNRVAHHHFRSFNLAWEQAHALALPPDRSGVGRSGGRARLSSMDGSVSPASGGAAPRFASCALSLSFERIHRLPKSLPPLGRQDATGRPHAHRCRAACGGGPPTGWLARARRYRSARAAHPRGRKSVGLTSRNPGLGRWA